MVYFKGVVMLQLTENARIVLERRYLDRKDGKLNETPEEMVRRVAKNVAAVEAQYDGDSARWEEEFVDIIDTLEFLPNSPTLMNLPCKIWFRSTPT